ncbi:MAG: DHH family phosphoesterase [Schwartzia sp.]|nr:DHH family phosphoesterase [Schwartzia sp. (in: firmicutes)]
MPRNLSAWADVCILLGASFALVAVLASLNLYMGAISAVIWICLLIFARERHLSRTAHFDEYCQDLVRNVNAVTNYAVKNLPQVILIVDDEGNLQWANKALKRYVKTNPMPEKGTPVQDFWPNLPIKSLWGMSGEYDFMEDDTPFRAVYQAIKPEGEPKPLMAFYVTDMTGPAMLKEMYMQSRLVLAFIQIDNYDEVLPGLSEAERTSLLFAVKQKLEGWAENIGGYLRQVKDDTFLAVMERRSLDQAIAAKFEVLDQVRSLRGSNQLPVTLSIGATVSDAQATSDLGTQVQKELDLALGRGGDQAVVLADGKTQFFGGKAQAAEKHTKVRARVVAHSLKELIDSASEVLVMGHQNEDFDAFGAALGVTRMVRHSKKPVRLVLSPMNEGIDKITELMGDYKALFTREAEVLETEPANPLLIVVDTHIPHMTAAPKLLQKYGSRVVVIDHHRRSETAIANPLLMYLEPSSSSTSELVTELLSYYDDNLNLPRMEATALYAGIIVDTKHFSVQAGSRTFEAAAYLRRAGADPVVIRHLFREDYETNIAVARAAASSKLYDGGLIITSIPEVIPNIQVIAAQAADSLLSIEGVHMSIVVFQLKPDTVGISARSSGELNVQVIMEQFGGGGHQNVAGAQIKNAKLPEIMEKAVNLATNYIKENG